MRGRVARLAPLLAAAFFILSGSASALTLPPPVTAACPAYGGVTVCSYEVPSFDGQPLDVDVTQPAPGTGARHPLIVMLHGFGNNKHEWESLTNAGDGADKYHWNNRWFAQHGYYVLTYTARGFQDKGTTGAYEPNTPPGALCGSDCGIYDTIHVKSRDYEIRDTQWLAALVAATHPDVNPNAVAVTGGSYGGGESWLQASQATWDFPRRVEPSLPVLELQVAVPKYPWTDLAYSLAPNGHGGGPSHADIYESSQTVPSTQTGVDPPGIGNPLGVPKSSYIAGLYSLGTTNGTFDEGVDEPFDENGPENITAWNARLTGVGDPYLPSDPILAQAARGLTVLRSAYYQTAGWASEATKREVAVFSVQGWTDDLFEAVESFRMFKYLKRLDPRWPVSVTVADVGHSRAQNPPAVWRRINQRAWGFVQSQIGGSHRRQTTVTSMATICSQEPDQPPASPADELTARTPEGLSHGALSISYGGGQHVLVNPLGVVDPNGPATDPILGTYFDSASPGNPCRTSDKPAAGGYTGISEPLPRHVTYVGLGEVDVPYTLTPGTTQAQIDARVWDVPPSGPAYLITRGTYRFDTLNGYDRPVGTVRLPLFGNEWRLAPGHAVRLDLTQVDAPYLRANNLVSSIAYGSPQLVLPTREAASTTLTGTP